jgi:hypothetical protein
MKNYELKNQVEEKTDSGILDQVIRANENYIKEQFIIKNKK